MVSTSGKKPKRRFGTPNIAKITQTLHTLGKTFWANLGMCVVVPGITILTLEWIARGTLGVNGKYASFWSALSGHFLSFFVAYLLLAAAYLLVAMLRGRHTLAVATVGILGNVPAIVTYYKLHLRSEPFLPWDILQLDELMQLEADKTRFDIPLHIVFVLLIFVFLALVGHFVAVPRAENGGKNWYIRLVASGAAVVMGCVLMFAIFLSPTGTAAIGIRADSWMQDRYYRNHGVVTGFLTNLQLLDITKPSGYTQKAIEAIAEETATNAEGRDLYYNNSYAAVTAAQDIVQQPNIIYVMAESFWDVTALKGIEYDQEILPNLTALKEEAAYGYCYSPSFGGGTCDVEFEALTGFSMEHLPSGSKPYQQYITQDIFSLPQYLRGEGYDTVAIHGYGARFWSRNTAYPRMGFNTFIASDDFENPIYRRGFISDESMVDRIIEEYSQRLDNEEQVFIHAVTMQNHTTYNRDRYPEDELVNVVKAPEGLEDNIIGQLEDCATGMREMDAALGKLVDYLRGVSEPTIVVFWGDHMNPMSDGYSLFETTGFIEEGETSSPVLMQTPLLIWSNYSNEPIELGTVAAYNITPVTMDLYGIEKPEMFEYLIQQMDVYRARTRGYTMNVDGSITEEQTEEQKKWYDKHALLQYDFLFGQGYLEDYTGG